MRYIHSDARFLALVCCLFLDLVPRRASRATMSALLRSASHKAVCGPRFFALAITRQVAVGITSEWPTARPRSQGLLRTDEPRKRRLPHVQFARYMSACHRQQGRGTTGAEVNGPKLKEAFIRNEEEGV